MRNKKSTEAVRIVQIIDSLNVGGAERMAVNISNALSSDDHDVLLISAREGGDLLQKLDKEVLYWNASKKSAIDICVFISMAKKIILFKPDIIHAHSSSIYWAIITKFFVPKSKIIFHDHFGMSNEIRPSDRKLFRLLSFYIDYIIAVNTKLLIWNQRYTRVEQAKVIYIPNFPYLRKINKSRLKKGNQSDFTIVCLANLRKQKDHITLVKALNLVKEKGFNFHVKLIGDKWGDECERSIRRAIRENNLGEQIHLLGALNDIETELAQSDIGVLSSISEGLPVSLLEYGLAALPVVVTQTGQCAEVIGYGKYGAFVPPKDPIALGEALIETMKDYNTAQRKGRKFKEHIIKEYGSERFLRDYYHLISS